MAEEHQEYSGLVTALERNLPALVRRCLLLGGRTLARKTTKLIVLVIQYVAKIVFTSVHLRNKLTITFSSPHYPLSLGMLEALLSIV